jgi:DNA repair photolyase
MRNYSATPATRALTPTGGFLERFSYSLNPYIGCAFGDSGGCPYCYVRALPVARAQAGPWGTWVIAKSNLLELLERELRALERSGKLERAAVIMSSATDPYQGMERRMRLTRGALELFVRRPPRRLLLQTRSPMIERDLDLLIQLGPHLIASITPSSPSIARRLAAARRLRAAGVFVQLAVSPMMPNDPERLAELADGAADRVVVDTYFDGDGSGGRRSRGLKMEELYARLGYEGWFRPGAERELMAAMRARMGAERVLFSREGFNAV